jgi:ABC-type sugar transport system, ATPase component
MENLALKMTNISKSFPGVKALKNVSFELKKGEIHALIGENGAGKSTLMNVLMGIYRPEVGEIYVDGKKCEIQSTVDAVALGIGMVPQELSLVPEATVAENIFIGNENKNKFGLINWKETSKNAKKFVNQIGVSIDVNAVVKDLSVAYQQLVQIARTLAAGAHILIFDEPTASLTGSEVDLLFKVMRQLKNEGKSIVFISHHLEELKIITDRITIMRDGEVAYTDDTENLEVDQIIKHMANREAKVSTKKVRKTSEDIILSVKNLSREKEFTDVSFDVHNGEIFGIGGLVGSKRTELINAIYGITKRSSGTMEFKGKLVDINSPQRAIDLGMGYLPEERRKDGIFPILSVAENLTITTYKKLNSILGINFKETKKITSDYIEKLNIRTPDKEALIKNLSGGNQQKVILSRWLALNVDLLILDEPTRGIDVNAKFEIYELIKSLAEKGLTVIIVSSEHEELLTLTDRIMVMHEGRVKGFLNSAEASQEDILMLALKK